MNRRVDIPEDQPLPPKVREALTDLRSVPDPEPAAWEDARQAYLVKVREYVTEDRTFSSEARHTASQTDHPKWGAGVKAFLLPVWERRPTSMLVRLLILLSIVFGGTLGTVEAAQTSLPGSTFYPIKLQIEDLRIARARDPETQVARAMEAAEKRLAEAERLTERSSTVPGQVAERYAEQVSLALAAADTLPSPIRSRVRAEIMSRLAYHLQEIETLRSVMTEDDEALKHMTAAIDKAASQGRGLETYPDYAHHDVAQIEFAGIVKAVNDDGSYLIDNWTVYTDHRTEFDPHKGAIVVGAWVEVEAYRRPDGTLIAKEIELEDMHDYYYDDVEFGGIVKAVNDDGSYLIDNWTVYTDHRTEFDPHRGAIVVGAWVEVEAYRQPDGTLIAEEIELED